LTDKERHIIDVYRNGETAVLTTVTGTVCPCYTAKANYSPDWHRTNTGAENCNRTLLISRTSTNTNILMMSYPASLKLQALTLSKEQMTVIGEIQEDDLVCYGIITAAGAEIDISALDEKHDYITYDSKKYIVRYHFPAIGYLQTALLRRINP